MGRVQRVLFIGWLILVFALMAAIGTALIAGWDDDRWLHGPPPSRLAQWIRTWLGW